jgi:hypothetical protein
MAAGDCPISDPQLTQLGAADVNRPLDADRFRRIRAGGDDHTQAVLGVPSRQDLGFVHDAKLTKMLYLREVVPALDELSARLGTCQRV